jgi:hypothetical protein
MFRIDFTILKDLRDEVIEYWKCRDMVLRGSRFLE